MTIREAQEQLANTIRKSTDKKIKSLERKVEELERKNIKLSKNYEQFKRRFYRYSSSEELYELYKTKKRQEELNL